MRWNKWHALAGGVAAVAVTGGALLLGSGAGAQVASVSITSISPVVTGQEGVTVSGECTGTRTDRDADPPVVEPAPPQNIAVFLTDVPVEGNTRPTDFIATAGAVTPSDFLEPTWPWTVTVTFPADSLPEEGQQVFVSAFCNHPDSQAFTTGSFNVGAPQQQTTTTTTTAPAPAGGSPAGGSPAGGSPAAPPTAAPAQPVTGEPSVTG
jgi:hypothetical protein